jgi:hypothetical protein
MAERCAPRTTHLKTVLCEHALNDADSEDLIDLLRKSRARAWRSSAFSPAAFPLPDQNGPNPSSRFTSPATIEILV